jgi:uncharacterized damage-inducible protein DinB
MNNIEFCLTRRKAEQPAFVNVLKALPDERLDYRPDPRSRTALQLAWILAVDDASLIPILDKGSMHWKEGTPPSKLGEIIAGFERNYEAVNERLARTDEATWLKPARLLMGGDSVWETTVGEFVWGVFFDMVHHRGQLSTYIRPMGGKVPAIYGPSADSGGQ